MKSKSYMGHVIQINIFPWEGKFVPKASLRLLKAGVEDPFNAEVFPSRKDARSYMAKKKRAGTWSKKFHDSVTVRNVELIVYE